MYEIFGKYGAVRQIRIGSDSKTKGTAFVVYEELADVGDRLYLWSHATEADITGQESNARPKWFSFDGSISRR